VIADNLGSLFAPDPSSTPGIALRQGILLEWDPVTGDNKVSVGGGILENVPVLKSEAGSLAVGNVVSLITDGTRWRLDGNLTTPGDPGTVPTWTADISALDENVTTINTVTIPAVQADTATALSTANTAAADAAAAQAAVDAATGITIPAIEADIAAAQGRLDTAEADIDAAQSALTAAQGDISTLQTGLDAAEAAVAAAQADVDAILPITETDISDNAITTPKINAGAITAAKLAADSVTAAAIMAGTITGTEIAAGAITAENLAADSITANEISSSYLYTGEILVDQLTGGTLAANILLASTISTASTGARVEMGPFGIVVYDGDDSPAIVLPTDSDQAATFKGDVEAAGLTVTGTYSFRSAGEVSTGGELTLQSGVTRPSAAPSVIVDWAQTPILGTQYRYGLHWDGSNWLSITDANVTPAIVTRSPTTGELVDSISLPAYLSNKLHPWGGITKIGSDYYTLSWVADGSSLYRIHKVNSSGTATVSVNYAPLAILPGASPAAVGTDGTNLLVAEYDSANNRFRIQVRSTTTLLVTSTVTTNSVAGFRGPVVGVYGGNSDLGSFRYFIAIEPGGYIWAFNSSGTYQSTDSFEAPSNGLRGFAWNGTNFYSATESAVFRHTGIGSTWGVNSPQTWYATSTWYDSDASGGTHETDMGPVATFSMRRRARVTLTAPTIPDHGGVDDPNAVRFYLGNTSTARTALWKQTDPSSGVRKATYTSVAFSGSNPPAANNFPGGMSGQINNSTESLVISGDGTIKGTLVGQPQPAYASSGGVQLTGQSVGTTFTAGSPSVGTTFVAPPTGKVYVTMGGRIQLTAANNSVYLSAEIRTGGTVGSGTVVQAASSAHSLGCGGNATGMTYVRAAGSHRYLLTGLTPGDTYNARTMHASQSGTVSADLFDRDLLIEPVL
jgi:hypothetical protein